MGRSKQYKARQAASKNNNNKSTVRAGPILAQQFSAPRQKIIIAVDYGTTYSGESLDVIVKYGLLLMIEKALRIIQITTEAPVISN
jgi:hypothetical protein